MLIDPLERFIWIEIILIRVFLHFDKLINNLYERISVIEIEIEHHLFTLMSFNIDGVIRSIKSFFVYLSYIFKCNVYIVKGLIVECLHTHMIKSLMTMARRKYNVSIFAYPDLPVHKSQYIYKIAFTCKLFDLDLRNFFFWTFQSIVTTKNF